MKGQRTLGEKARDAIRAGKVPARAPDRMWGGRGDGAECSVCHAPVKNDEVEFELEFIRAGDLVKHHLHLDCFTAWERERDNAEPARDDLQRSA